MQRHPFFSILLALLAGTAPLFGLAEEQIGPDKDRSHPTTAQNDWPAGMVALPRHDSRVYSIWVNGHENFHFLADPDALNELIDLFAKTRLRDHEISIKPGTPTVKPFRGDPITYNVQFTFLGGIYRGVDQESMEPKTYDPTLTIHLDPATAPDTLAKLTIPDHIILHNEIAGSSLKGKATKPTRTVHHARVHFEDGSPATDFENGISTRITLWEKDQPAPLGLGGVSHEGKFHTALSDAEIAHLKSGRFWLTMTTGNWSTQPDRADPKIPIDRFTLDPEATKPVTISKPGFYHGRVLFEDGSPPVLDPLPWPGAKIRVEFPYTNPSDLDAEGYFRVYFNETQIAELKKRKSRKNIYVPLYGQKGRSRALHTFPAELLSKDKTKAGVIKIPKPTPSE